MSDFQLSVCIPTNGAKKDKTIYQIFSLLNANKNKKYPLEIILAGDVDQFDGLNCKLVNAKEDAHKGMLAKLRHLASKEASFNKLLFVDDDFLFNDKWLIKLDQFSRHTDWDVLTNRVLIPSGGRFWDRSLIKPHKMVSYDHDPYDKNLYITGGFWLMTRKIYDKEPWDATIPIYATKKGLGNNEDIDLSLRLHKRDIPLLIDPDNYVWHWDDRYKQNNQVVSLGVEDISKRCDKFKVDLDNVKRFIEKCEVL